MAKRSILALGALIALIIILFFGYRFFMSYEFGAKERSVEKMVASADLAHFGGEEDILTI